VVGAQSVIAERVALWRGVEMFEKAAAAVHRTDRREKGRIVLALK
jgi:hypothetical protein